MSENDTKETIDFMLRQFKPERYAYLTVTIVSFILLLVCVTMFIINPKNEMNKENFGYVTGMVGSGGAVAYTASQLLKMWRDCMDLFIKSLNNPKDHE